MNYELNDKLERYLDSSLPLSCTTQKHLIDIISSNNTDVTKSPIFYGLHTIYDIVESYGFDNSKVDKTEIAFVLDRFRNRIIDDMQVLFGDIYNLLVQLSAEQYESNSVSDMALTVMNSNQIQEFKDKIVEIDVKANIGFNNIRALRKSINITEADSKLKDSSNYCLILEPIQDPKANELYQIYGLIDRDTIIKKYPVIYLLGKLRWAVELPQNERDDGKPIEERCSFRFENNRILLPLVSEVKYKCKLIEERLMRKGIESSKAKIISENIEEVIKIAKYQKHGTGAVFLPASIATNEITRLFQNCRSYKVDFNVEGSNKKILYSLTNIDGVTIIDYENNKCVAFGSILDGITKNEGNSERGSRFNSIKTYLENLSLKNESEVAIGLVVSEDKTIDILVRDNKKHKASIL